MADTDSDIDKSPPTTPTRAPSVLSPLTPTPTHQSRTLRFSNLASAQPIRYSFEALLYSPEDPFTAPDKPPPSPNKSKGNISKYTEDAVFDEVRDAMIRREQIAEEYSKALDEATSRVQKLGLELAMGQLERALAQVIRSFAHGENLRRETEHPVLSRSTHAFPQFNELVAKYDQIMIGLGSSTFSFLQETNKVTRSSSIAQQTVGARY